jgi:predicted MPP superfamily phosphohydrolase
MRWFLIVWIILMILVYTYMGRRLIIPAQLKRYQKFLAWAVVVIIPLTQPLSFLLRQNAGEGLISDIISWISYIGFGFYSLILAGLITRDLYLLFSTIFKKMAVQIRRSNSGKRAFDPSRRSFLINATNMGILGTSAIMTGYGIYEARRKAYLEKVTIPVANLPVEFEGFTIAQFSDIHAGNTIKRGFILSVVDQINNLNADTIVFTGDMVDGTVPGLRNDIEPLKDLSATQGVFYITGNHEYYNSGGAEPWVEEMDRLGLIVLLNDHKIIQRNQSQLLMAGVTDFRGGDFIPAHRSDPVKALGNKKDSDIKILLAHQPKSIFASADLGFDLQISGHTHGGQYFPWNFLVTLDQPYISGLHRHHNTWIYVNRGTGYWGPPIRIGIPSEVTLFTLTKKKSDQDTVI